MTNGRLISPAEAANCNPITRRAVGFTPYSGGSVSAAGNVEETPRPVPTAAAHRTTRDSHIKKQSDDARHTAVFATSMGQAVETRPERTAHRIRPALIAIQKFDVMMAINSSGTLRGAYYTRPPRVQRIRAKWPTHPQRPLRGTSPGLPSLRTPWKPLRTPQTRKEA